MGSELPQTQQQQTTGRRRTSTLAAHAMRLAVALLLVCLSLAAVPASVHAQETPCAPGSYNLTAVDGLSWACTPCPAGFECLDPPVPCLAGRWSLEGSANCTDCAAGQACPDTTGVSNTACLLGTYSIGNATSCTPCPAGSACPLTDQAQEDPCAPGFYSLGSASVCTGCLAGWQCPLTNAAPVSPADECALGSYSLGNATSCTTCPAGSECPVNNASPVPCAVGEYALEGSTDCTTCIIDSFCPNTTITLPCPAGSTSLAASTECTVCPAGSSCALGVITPCAAGSYSLLAEMTCTTCPAGSSCFDPAVSPVPCAVGEYALEGATGCTTCIIDSFCPNTTITLPCPAGSTSPAASTNCTVCPAGSSCALGVITPCAAGSYSLLAEMTCTTCPAGSSCFDPAVSPVPCAVGEYALEGATGCTSCLADSFCPNTTLTLPCATGSTSLARSTNCTTCPAGSACALGVITPCSPGSYAAEGDMVCTTCEAGFTCLDPAVAPVSCNLTANSYSNAAATVCIPCALGSIANAARTSCGFCALNHYCTSLGELRCPAGSWSDPGTANSACQFCPAGFICPADLVALPLPCASGTYSLINATECTECPAGKKCPDTNSLPYSCLPGTYSTNGSISCTTCPAGFFCLDPSVAPVPCLAGEYALEGASGCTICPADSFCANVTLSPVLCANGTTSLAGATNCTDCPAGSSCNDGIITPCLPGTYSAVGGTGCITCPAGFSCADSAVAPVPCVLGHFAVAGSSFCSDCAAGLACPNTRGANITYCAMGTYSLGNATSCTTCTEGYICPYTDQPMVEVCPPGTYSLRGDWACTVCPAGYQCPLNNAAPANPADVCKAGTYSLEGQIACTQCPAGMACPFTNVAPSVACPAGTLALNGSASCQACSAGFYCPDATAEVPCPATTYSAQGASACSPCPPGFDCAGPFAANPNICSAGRFSGLGNSSCEPCIAGFYCGTSGMDVGDEQSNICPAGSYCPAGSPAPLLCPIGTYNTSLGVSALTSCAPCPAGYFCDEGTAQFVLNVCPPGFACPTGTGVDAIGAGVPSITALCPAGTWNPNLGAVNISSCLPCAAGNFCPQGSAALNVCPAAYYCPTGTQAICAAGMAVCDLAPPQACPAGTFSPVPGLTDPSECQDCPAGAYCPLASLYPTPCPAGSYNPTFSGTSSGSCLLCPAGSACPLAGLHAPGTNCSTGHYCPLGTVYPSDNPCPPGFYSDSLTASASSDCLPCPKGFFCGYGTGGVQNPPLACTAGHFCPAGVSTPSNCPAGTWSNQTTNSIAGDCLPCPAGKYCLGATASEAAQLDCTVGHYCPRNTGTPEACPAGTYNPSTSLEREDQCLNCPSGYWCGAGVSLGTACAAGEYNNYTHQTTSTACLACPGGYTCPGSANTYPRPCGLGTFSASGSSADPCLPCTAGFYCPNVTTSASMMATYPCTAGALCPAGTGVVPLNSAARLCPMGQFCPTGTGSVGQDCDPGTYNPNLGRISQAECLDCPKGQFCLGGESTPSGNCSAGHYCTGKASTSTQYPCPIGTYRLVQGGSSADSCAWCPGGYICPTLGLVNPVACPRGSYCLPNSTIGNGCPIGTYGNTTGLQSAALCSPCDAGHYCASPGLTEPTGLCDAGYYCLTGVSNSIAANQAAVGGLCPLGGYCPPGSTAATPCPLGTYGNGTGLSLSSQCIPCPAGSYCQGTGQTSATGLCSPGYFCVQGGGYAQPPGGLCPAGFYCPGGTGAPTACPQGQFQTTPGASVCSLCDAGYYCPSLNSTFSVECPLGSYCVAGSSAPVSCPPGTIGQLTLRKSLAECTPCPLGYWCGGGVTAQAPCGTGVYCPGNMTNVNGIACPTGAYCPALSPAPTPCGVGFYQPLLNRPDSGSCVECTAGSYCSDPQGAAVTGPCSAGFYCPAGSTSAAGTPSGGICPVNTFCSGGSPTYSSCLPGTFSNGTGASICQTCLAGHYCPGSSDITQCPAGYWCAAGASSTTPTALSGQCPSGTFGVAGLSAVSQCTPCPAGEYCTGAGQASTTGPCLAGYLCSGSATVSNPLSCPAGSYCPEGTLAAVPCPVGTFRFSSGGASLADCTTCPPTRYCANSGATGFTGTCSSGYFCGGNATSATPATDAQNGRCVAGFECPAGSSVPLPCATGSYSDVAGAGSCSQCPEGYFCPTQSTDGQANPCPAGSYCPAGSVDPPPKCPAGTYSNSGLLTALSQCTGCPAGEFCSMPGQTATNSSCAAGFLCIRNATTSNPTDGVLGIRCPPGTFCPAGTPQTLTCTLDHYCSGGMGVEDGFCGPGAYCLMGDSDKHARACPAGSYCPGSGAGVMPCGAGKMSAIVNATSDVVCTSCTAGAYCNGTGMVPSAAVQCPESYFCPAGSSVPDQPPAGVCTTGHYCPAGTIDPLPCGPGLFQDEVAATTCKTVPAGYYSNVSTTAGNVGYTICPSGSYCPDGTNSPTQYLCPPGTFFAGTGATSILSCQPCTAGFYCDEFGMTTGSDPAKRCNQGFYCHAGSNTSMPTDGVHGNVCTYGSYCDTGSSNPQPCPSGKLAPSLGSTSVAACTDCPAGQYCPSSLLSGGLCYAGYWCKGSAIVPNPNGLDATGEPCAAGTYCVEGTAASPPLCDPGTYNPNVAQESCLPCPIGKICATPGLSTFADCPAGFYCEGSNAVGTPCPSGTFSNMPGLTSASQCTPCTAGSYCAGPDTTAPTAQCAAGYLCTPGSDTATPSGVYPAPGPCPVGHYCTQGTTTPTPCDQGSFNPITGAANSTGCGLCTPGSYCALPGQWAVTGPCQAGYYCPAGSTVANPTQCPPGTYCPGGDAFPIPCLEASYNSQGGRTSCLPCAAGWTCANGSTTATGSPCPLGHFCPAGQLPQPCLAGTFGQIVGLQNATQCSSCPGGVYCANGFVTGNCTAGYLCKAGNPTQNPVGPLDAPGAVVNGGPCPSGFYCPTGTLLAVACPEGTSRVGTGGSQASDCGPCEAGYECLSNVPILCPQGFYCPVNNTFAIPCGLGTYGPLRGGFNQSSCLPCVAGFTCNQYNMSDYHHSPCPVGHWCPTGATEAQACPAGTYRATISGTALGDCAPCPQGFACGVGTSAPVKCLAGSYCPQSSSVPTPCPPGWYCAPDASLPSSAPIVPVICPAGFYCAGNSTTFVICEAPFYCPQGSSSPLSCPLGSYNISTNDRTSEASSCDTCPAGTFSINPEQPVCEPCTPGYVCGVGTNTATPMVLATDYGYQCGVGEYCPEGSTAPLPCPAGYYNPVVASGSCLPCLNNSFSALPGASTCMPCGSSAYAGLGATTCTCNGTYRAYQWSDGSCKCKPGYEFYDNSNTLFAGDSPEPCQPVVYSECKGLNRNSRGDCISDEYEACSIACAGSALRLANAQCDVSLLSQPDGVLDVVTQVCTCANVPILSYCDASCRANRTVLSLGLDGRIGIVNPSNGFGTTVTQAQLAASFGFFAPQLACTKSSGCTMTGIVTAASGHRALLDLPPSIANLSGISTPTATICNFTVEALARGMNIRPFAATQGPELELMSREHHVTLLSLTPSWGSSSSASVAKPAGGRLLRAGASIPVPSRRSLSASNSNPYEVAPTLDYLQTLRGYYNPTLCLQIGESVFWQIDDAAHYPVYQKDNFLNSNPDFDYGVFVQLGEQLNVGAAITTFAFTFFTTGTYVFADAANDERLTIIAVLDLSVPCPSGNKVLPTSSASLKPLGIGQVIAPTTAPDLTLIWALLGMFLGLVVVLAIVAKLKQKKAQRALALAAEDDSVARNDFKQLYLEIREQKKVHKGMFNKQRDHFRSECDRICAETEQVKALLATKMTDGRGFVDAAINLLLQELTARNSYGNRQSRRETDMFTVLNTLKRMLDDAGDMAEHPIDIPTAQISEQVEVVANKVGEVIAEAEKERMRKRHLHGNAGIIGDEVVRKLTEHSFSEESKENAFLAKLKVFRAQCLEYKSGVHELQTDLDDKVRVLQDRRNAPAIEGARLKTQRKVSDMASGLNIDLERLLGILSDMHAELRVAREETVEDENESLEVLEQRKLDVEALVQTGIFAGLEEDLAEAIKFFLCQARQELLPMQPAFEQAAMMGGGAMTLGRAFGQAEFATGGGGAGGGGGGAAGADRKRGEGQPGEDASAVVEPSAMVENTAAELAAAADEEAERQRKAALENAEGMSVDELRQLYADLRQREEMMLALQRSEEERQKRLAEELLKSESIEPEDEMLLGRAKEILDGMVEVHRREEEELHSKLKSDEEVRIASEIAALSIIESNIERKKKDLADEMSRRNELAASESEKMEIAHEHQVQLKSLEESLRADKMQAQKALGKIHDDMRTKLRQAKKDMKTKQAAESAEARAEFDKVKDEVGRKIEEKSVKVEGVDLQAIEQSLAQAQANPVISRKQEALEAYHLQQQQDMVKQLQSEERKLAEESERERQKELELLERSFEARKDQQIAELEAKLKFERDSLGDEEQAKSLLLQHQNQLRALAIEIDSEKARQKAGLNAALAKKRKAKEAKLRADHELALEKELLEQSKEIANTEKQSLKKKEMEALSLILTRENHRKAKAIIEKLIKPRQHKELSALIQENFKESALSLAENLEKSMESAGAHREEVERRLKAKEITVEEAEVELKAIEREVDPDAIKQSTLQYLEPQHNEKLTLQKRAHLQEVRDLMKKFYPNEDFSGAEWNLQEQIVNVAAMMKEGEERKKRQEEAYAEQVREMERKEAEQLKELEALKAARLAELKAQTDEEHARLSAEFEASLAARRKEFEEQQKKDQERAMAIEMEALAAREQEAAAKEAALAEKAAAAAAAGEGEDAAAPDAAESAAVAAEKAAIAEEKKDMLTELAEAQREVQRQQEQESERQRKKFASKLAMKAQEAKLAELAKLEEEHSKSIEQQKKNLSASAEKLKKSSEEEENRKKEVINLASRAFVKFGRAYADHRAIGVKNAVRRIRKVYDKARAAGKIGFGLVPGPVAGTMLQVPLQPGMAIIGGGGAIAGEGGVGAAGMMMGGGGAGGAGGLMMGGGAGGMGMGFPGVGESGAPFYNKLESISSTLTKLLKTGNDGMFQPDVLPYFASGEEDLKPSGAIGSKIQEMSLMDLSPKKFVLYRFGLFILDFLTQAHQIPSMRLLLCKSLPPRVDAQKFAENAFKNSFFFDPLSRIIFVRVERTEEVGEFTLLLIHTVSHILAQDWSDAHPRFTEFFHRSIQFICSELFFARTKKGYAGFGGSGAQADAAALAANKKHASQLLQPGETLSASSSSAAASFAASAVVLPSPGISYKELQSLFGLVNKLEFKEDLVGEFLDLHQLGSGADDLFSEDLMLHRMEQYKMFNLSAPLNGFLRDLERTALSSKQDATLQSKLNSNKDKNMSKLGDKDDKSTAPAGRAARRGSVTGAQMAAAAAAAAPAPAPLSNRDRLKASIDRLLEESDTLHSQLLGVIGAMQPVSESLLSHRELLSKLAHAKVSPDAPQFVEASTAQRLVEAKLKRLNIDKEVLQQRIESVEDKYKQKMAEMGSAK